MSWEINKEEDKQEKAKIAEANLRGAGVTAEQIEAMRTQKTRSLELFDKVLDRALEESKDGKANALRSSDNGYSGVVHTILDVLAKTVEYNEKVDSAKSTKLLNMFITAVIEDDVIKETVEVLNGKAK